jgi:hypothetical protein
MVRREKNLPSETVGPAGTSIRRNPGVALVWPTRWDGWSVFTDDEGGVLFDVGEPHGVRWFAEGRAATRREVLASIASGLPLLASAAAEEGQEALDQLEAMRTRALALVPSA